MLMQAFMFVLSMAYLAYLVVLKVRFHDDSLFIYGYGILALLSFLAGFALAAGAKALGCVLTGTSCALLAGIAVVLIVASHRPVPNEPTEPVHWIAVLGCALYNQRPGRILSGRLDLALTCHNRYPKARMMVCGGRGADEQVTEAAAMAQYLEERGVPAACVIQEDASSTTREGLENFARICGNKQAHVLIVTSDFHAERTARVARECGLTTFAIAASKTPPVLWVNLTLRDACARFAAKVFPGCHNVWVAGRRL